MQPLVATLGQAVVLTAATWVILRIARRLGDQIDRAEKDRAHALEARTSSST